MAELTEKHARALAHRRERVRGLREEVGRDLAGAGRVVFEPGCGHGHWLADYAAAHPDRTCVGIDLVSKRIRKACAKAEKWELPNLLFFKAELTEFLEALPGPVRFDMTVFLFPDPWPKARHHRRRMVQPHTLDALGARTDPGGLLCFRSDNADYCEWTRAMLEEHPLWDRDGTAAWPHEHGTYFQEFMDAYVSLVARRTAVPAAADPREG